MADSPGTTGKTDKPGKRVKATLLLSIPIVGYGLISYWLGYQEGKANQLKESFKLHMNSRYGKMGK